MTAASRKSAKIIALETTTLEAAKCDKCGAKIYPESLLGAHLIRHQARRRWFDAEIKKLQFTLSHMRDFA